MPFLRRFSGCAALVAAFVVIAGAVESRAQTKPATATALLDTAKAAALEEQKSILVEFCASWCGWCRRFDEFVQSPEVGSLIDKHYVVVKFVVQESPDKRALNTLGAQDMMDTWGGSRSGLPFYVFLNAKGEKIATSNAMASGANVGYPATPAEIESFVRLIELTSPAMSPADRGRIAQYFKAHVK